MGPGDESTASASCSETAGVTDAEISFPAIKKLDHVHSSITKIKEPLDNTNWAIWRIFTLCGVGPYIYGTLPHPDETLADLGSVIVWDQNDVYTQILITNNITQDQMVHVSRLNMAYEIWKSLEAIHKTQDYQVAIAIQRGLFRQCATDDDDIVDHLTQLKKRWERLNVLDNKDFCITDIQFKTIIGSSLPPSSTLRSSP